MLLVAVALLIAPPGANGTESQAITPPGAGGPGAQVVGPPDGVGVTALVITPLGAGESITPAVADEMGHLIEKMALYAGWDTGALSQRYFLI